jgi:SAM-dependent methyltransferase
MQIPENEKTRQAVKERYGEIAKEGSKGCGCSPSCCGEVKAETTFSESLGYSVQELTSIPEGADLSLGCGNPVAIASLKPGQVVLDLGSGGGLDCFLAAQKVGERGLVIGVDMTPEMIKRARENAAKGGFQNVEFRLGEIEHLPVADNSVDVIISNCVINLSPEKRKVFQETYRVLKPGGRLAISDIVATKPMPEAVQKDLALYVGCVSGAALVTNLEKMLQEAGFEEIKIETKEKSREIIQEWAPASKVADYVASATIEAKKPE